MPSVLDRIIGRKPKPEAVKHEEPIPLMKVEGPMLKAPSEPIKQPDA